jgi:hypothetical protein
MSLHRASLDFKVRAQYRIFRLDKTSYSLLYLRSHSNELYALFVTPLRELLAKLQAYSRIELTFHLHRKLSENIVHMIY